MHPTDRDVVLASVRADGLALQFACEDLRDDDEVQHETIHTGKGLT